MHGRPKSPVFRTRRFDHHQVDAATVDGAQSREQLLRRQAPIAKVGETMDGELGVGEHPCPCIGAHRLSTQEEDCDARPARERGKVS
jgi:hypothetical protein